MPKGEELSDNAPKLRRIIPRSRRSRIGLGVLIGLLVGVILAWTQRETIADDLISSELAKLGIDVSYEIVSIGPRRQILRNVVVGDKGNPDLTIEEVEVAIAYGFGTPGMGGLKLTNPHLLASYDQQDGLSFGALDAVIFAESEEPAGLPDFDLEVSGGVITFQSAQGNGRLGIAGQGGLADGFQGRDFQWALSRRLPHC